MLLLLCCDCYCWYCCYCCTYVCMYVVVDDGGASVFTSNWHQPLETRVETDETMKLLLASATSLVTRVAYGRLKNCQAQRANQASDSSLPRGHQLPPPPSWRWMGGFNCMLAFRVHRPPSWRWMGSFHFLPAFRVHRPRAGAGWAASTSCWHEQANQASDSSLPISMVYIDGLRVISLQRITWGRTGTNPCLCLL